MPLSTLSQSRHSAPCGSWRSFSGALAIWVGALVLSTNSFAAPAPPVAASRVASAVRSTANAIPLRLREPFSASVIPGLSSRSSVAYVAIKFRDDAPVRLLSGNFENENGSLTRINDIIAQRAPGSGASGSAVSKLFSTPDAQLSRVRSALSQVSQTALADLRSYYQIAVTDPIQAREMIDALNLQPEVEIAYAMPQVEVAGDIAPPTADFSASQTYRNAAPAGINSIFANTLAGGDGAGVKVIDIEIGWHDTHEDLDVLDAPVVAITVLNADDNHGTAVMGELIAGDNGYGVTGICPGAQAGMISVAVVNSAEALYTCADYLAPGDVVLIELHAPGPRYNFESRSDQLGYVCLEYFPAEYDAIQYLWARGIVVVEAAGNGAENYNDVLYGQLFDTTYRNSHAIIVGAGGPSGGASDRTRLSFSNYGTRVNLQGYGSGVTTTGYGGLFFPGSDKNQAYTATFSGTSSASPIVTGAAICAQGRYAALYGAVMTSDMIRDLLVSTGSPQLGMVAQHIGPRPDLAAAFVAMNAPPSLYSAPIYIDTAVAPGMIENITATLHNRSLISSVAFSVSGEDSLALSVADWLQASPVSGVVPPGGALDLTVTLDAAVVGNRFTPYSGHVKINWGISPGPLDSLLVVPVYMTVPCDDTTYLATTSDSVSGPVYSWIDITTSGVMIPAGSFYNSGSPALDDGTAGPIFMQVDVPFFGAVYNECYIGVNGAISFTDTAVNANGFYATIALPPAPFTTLIAAFWNDLALAGVAGGHGQIYFKPFSADSFVVSWEKVGNFNSAADTLVSFQIILRRNGDISFQYKEVGTTGLNATAVIGVTGVECEFEPFVNSGAPLTFVPDDNDAVRFAYAPPVFVMAGDADHSGGITIGDAVFLIAYIFSGGAAPSPLASGDPDCSGDITIGDAIYLISYIFLGGPPPCSYSI